MLKLTIQGQREKRARLWHVQDTSATHINDSSYKPQLVLRMHLAVGKNSPCLQSPFHEVRGLVKLFGPHSLFERENQT